MKFSLPNRSWFSRFMNHQQDGSGIRGPLIFFRWLGKLWRVGCFTHENLLSWDGSACRVRSVCMSCVDLQHFFCKPKNILESETDHSKDTRSCTILNLTCWENPSTLLFMRKSCRFGSSNCSTLILWGQGSWLKVVGFKHQTGRSQRSWGAQPPRVLGPGKVDSEKCIMIDRYWCISLYIHIFQ